MLFAFLCLRCRPLNWHQRKKTLCHQISVSMRRRPGEAAARRAPSVSRASGRKGGQTQPQRVSLFRVPCVSTHHTDTIFEVDKWLIRAGVRHGSARKAFVEKSLVGTMGVLSALGLQADVDRWRRRLLIQQGRLRSNRSWKVRPCELCCDPVRCVIGGCYRHDSRAESVTT